MPRKYTKIKELTISQRWEQGLEHDSRSTAIYTNIAEIDFFENGNAFNFKAGGDGDNGETLMYLLDVHFEREDMKALEASKKKKAPTLLDEASPEELNAQLKAIEDID